MQFPKQNPKKYVAIKTTLDHGSHDQYNKLTDIFGIVEDGHFHISCFPCQE